MASSGFGRRFIDVEPYALTQDVVYQLGALQAFAAVAGTRVRYVKPHGALYNAIVTHEQQAAAVVQAVLDHDPALPVLGLPGSAWLRRAEQAGLRVVREAFADRAYTPEATLVPRRLPGAVLHDADEIARRCVAMATGQPVTDVDGGALRLFPESICVHGDTPGAVDIARRVFSPEVAEVAWARRVVEAMGEDGRGAVMLDGKMQDDATWKQCSVVLRLARDLAARDPELAAAYDLGTAP